MRGRRPRGFFWLAGFTLVGVVLAVALGLASPALAITISQVEYTVLGIGGNVSAASEFEIYQSNTVIDGNVGESPNTLSSGATVYGMFLGSDLNITLDHGNSVGEAVGGGDGSLVSSGSTIDSLASVPESATLLLVGSGLVGLGIWGRKRLFRRTAGT